MPKLDEIILRTLPELFDDYRLQRAAVFADQALAHVAQYSNKNATPILVIP